MDGGNTDLLALLSSVLGSQHGGIWGRLVSVSLNLHTTGNSGNRFLTGEIGDVNEGVVEGCKDTGNTENLGTIYLLVLEGGVNEQWA